MKILQNLNEVNTILGLLKINKTLKTGYNGRRETAIDYITIQELNTLDYEDLNLLQRMIAYENSILC
jgi:ribosomal protein S18